MKSRTFEQNEAIEKLRQWKVGALFMEAGTGKTRVSLELVNRISCDAVLWIGPLRTLENTRTEINKWGGFHVPVSYVSVESLSLSDRIYLKTIEFLESYSKSFIIVDESLKIKNVTAKRTERILALSKFSEYRLILNGTPFSKNISDIWAQMQFLSPKIFNMTYNQFLNTFCVITRLKRIIGNRTNVVDWISGYANIDYMYSLIRHYIYQCNLHLDIFQMFQTLHYTVTPEEFVEYEHIKNTYLDEEKMTAMNNQIFMAMTTSMQMSYCCSANKFLLLDDLFKRISQEHTIIFCRFVISQQMCRERYPKAMVLSYQKHALGLNLQQYNHTVYFDKIWDYALYTQSLRRTFRTGQEYDCFYYDLTANLKLDGLITRNISNKRSSLDYLKNKTIEDIRSDLDDSPIFANKLTSTSIMDIKIYEGLSPEVYQYVGPFAMNRKFITQNGNPITTSNKHKWYVGFGDGGQIVCFCSIQFNDTSKLVMLGNMFILQGGKDELRTLLKRVISDVTPKHLKFRAYANNDTCQEFESLGFKFIQKRVNWHTMEYDYGL